MMRVALLLLGMIAFATIAFAQGPPPVVWEVEAAATNLTFSADGETMYTGGAVYNAPFTYGNIKKWDVTSRSEVYTLTSNGSEVIGQTNGLAVNSDGTAFASGHGSVRCPAEGPCVEVAIGFNVWNAASGTSLLSLDDGDIDGLVQSVTFSPDGEFVAFVMSRSTGDQIRVYDYPAFTLQSTYEGHGDGTYCADFSPMGNLLATGGSDGKVRLWDVETQQLVRTIEHGSYTSGGTPTSVDFSPDGSRLAVAGRGYDLNATVWDVTSGELIYSLEAGAGRFGTSLATIAFTPNGSYLVAGVSRYVSPEWGGLIRIWDMADGSLAREYTEETVGSVGSSLSVAVSPAAEGWIAYTYDDKVKFADTGLDFGDIVLGGQGVASVPTRDNSRQLNIRAYPNPFNPSTTISFVLPESAPATLGVYDVSGNLVRTLLNGVVRADGPHEVVWNGRNDAGQVAATGVYFCKLDAGGYSEVQRMTMLK